MDLSEKKLIIQCKKNNKDALNKIYLNYQNYIYSICYNFTHSREDSLDLLHDIFIKILKNIKSFDESKPLLPWIKRITINTCINFNNRKKNTISLDKVITDSGQTLKESLASQFNLENFILFQDSSNIINEEIAKIEDKFKMPLILRHKHEMSYDEIASYMNIPLGTVKTNIFRGRKILKANLVERGLWG